MKKKGRIEYPNILCEFAKDLALARWLIDKEVRGSNNEYQRNDKATELEIETKGILGELIVRYYLETNNKEYIPSPLIAEKPIKEADVIIGNFRIDVKASNNGSHFMVNENAHKKGKGKIDFYWFVILKEDGLATFYIYPYADVDKWDLIPTTFTNAYVKSIVYDETIHYS